MSRVTVSRMCERCAQTVLTFRITYVFVQPRVAYTHTHTHTTFNKKRALFTNTLDLELKKKLLKCYIWSMALFGAETWTFRVVHQKHLEIFEMWCCRGMEKISWTDRVRNEEVLLRVKEKRIILLEMPYILESNPHLNLIHNSFC